MSAKQTPNLLLVTQKPNRTTRTSVDTLEVTADVISRWRAPPFQRPIKINEKVRTLSQMIKETGVLPGFLTLGVLDGVTYLMDGQHRVEAFKLSELPSAYVDVRVHHVATMGEMGEEFVALNSALVRFTPDDILRGLESSNESIRLLRTKCSFVGYDQIRRGDRSPVVSASALIRCWTGSGGEVPDRATSSIAALAAQLSIQEAETLTEFAQTCFTAWGREETSIKLWGALNLVICAWLYRRLVLTAYSAKVSKMPRATFQKCLMSLAADATYTDWLVGRNSGERDRSPCYARICSIFKTRIEVDTGKRPMMPAPPWAGGHSGGR